MTRRRRRLAALAATLLVLEIAWRVYRVSCGSPAALLADTAWTESTRVLARDGRVLGELRSAEGLRGRPTTLAEMGDRIVLATLESEDRRFYAHDGVDRFAVVRALFLDVSRLRFVSGGSTITQQLVKRLDHHGRPRARSVRAKLAETARAMNLEASVDKPTILAAYMNRLDYGRGFAGPEAAARGYFGVPARDLSLAQATLLAVLPRAPSALDPYRHRERALLRQRALLRSLHAHGSITPEDLERALGEPLVFRDPSSPSPFLAPHVVASRHRSHRVATTIDFDLQRDVEALVRSHMPRLTEKGASTAAVVVVDTRTGEVLAEVSGPDWFDSAHAGKVDLVRARRQAGSTLKPLVYARAFERNVSPMDPLPDVPTDFGSSSARYAPDNFDGTFLGPVPAREALAGSLNVPAVKLARDLGAEEVVATLRSAGLQIVGGASRYGLSIALGSAEVSPLELAEAYTTLARGGEHISLKDRAGATSPAQARIFEPSAVAAVSDALSDPFARVRGLRTRGPFELPFPVAVKTGTSTAYRDAWTAGYTKERVVVVWVGNADGGATPSLTGAVGAGPLFYDVMKRSMRDVDSRGPLYEPALLERVDVCPLSGRRAGAACSARVARRVPRGHASESTCSLHRLATTSPLRCDAHGTTPIVVLPSAYDHFLALYPPGGPELDPFGVPWYAASALAGCRDAPETPRIVVLAPKHGAVVPFDPTTRDVIEVDVATQGLPPQEPLEVVVDGRVAMRLDAPYRARVPVGRGDHLFEVRPLDAHRAAQLGRATISVR